MTARDRFEQVTELDENNERAWFYLAQVVDTDEDRCIALKNVLVINPQKSASKWTGSKASCATKKPTSCARYLAPCAAAGRRRRGGDCPL
jgi:hypothetical protein